MSREEGGTIRAQWGASRGSRTYNYNFSSCLSSWNNFVIRLMILDNLSHSFHLNLNSIQLNLNSSMQVTLVMFSKGKDLSILVKFSLRIKFSLSILVSFSLDILDNLRLSTQDCTSSTNQDLMFT